jgi:hypothetical protein
MESGNLFYGHGHPNNYNAFSDPDFGFPPHSSFSFNVENLDPSLLDDSINFQMGMAPFDQGHLMHTQSYLDQQGPYHPHMQLTKSYETQPLSAYAGAYSAGSPSVTESSSAYSPLAESESQHDQVSINLWLPGSRLTIIRTTMAILLTLVSVPCHSLAPDPILAMRTIHKINKFGPPPFSQA